jgi:hypothetical protein
MEREIKAANQLYLQHHGIWSGEATLLANIDRYRGAISGTYLQMEKLGILKACTDCAGVKPGGCCFKGVEEWYDATPLLMNRLLGVDLPTVREVQEGCLFVGSRGCKLIARHPFCVNYLCPDLMASLTEAQARTLAAISGEELRIGWELEKSIRDLIMDLR